MSDRKVALSVQKNSNREKIVTREASIGEVGEAGRKVRFSRFGQAEVFDMTIRVTSPVCVDLMGAVAEIEVADD